MLNSIENLETLRRCRQRETTNNGNSVAGRSDRNCVSGKGSRCCDSRGWLREGNTFNEDGKTWFQTNELVYVSSSLCLYTVSALSKHLAKKKEEVSLNQHRIQVKKHLDDVKRKDERFCKHEWIARVNWVEKFPEPCTEQFSFTLRETSGFLSFLLS